MSTSPNISASDLRETILHLRESLVHQQLLIDRLIACLEQTEELCNAQSDQVTSAAWRPTISPEMLQSSLPAINLRKISQPDGAFSMLPRLIASWVNRVYQERLKKIPSIRWLIIWLWRNLYPVYTATYARIASRTNQRWRTVIKLAEYVSSSQSATILVFEAAQVDTPAPKVLPIEDQTSLLSPHSDYVFPQVYVTVLAEIQVYGGTNLMFAQDSVICHDLYDFEHDYTSEELHGRHVIDAKKMRMRLLRYDPAPEKIASAAVFLDACAPNYAHWLTEVLPRIATFCAEEQFANIPIIVDDGLHQNIMESLALLVGSSREIITLPIGRSIQISQLYVTSATGYVPFEKRGPAPADHSHGHFCPLALKLICDRFSSFVENLPLQEWPRKIYLRRTASSRNLVNAVEIEQSLLKNGYVAIEPEKLSFIQQVALFCNADSIVGSSGAALANLIFAPSTASVCIVIGKFEGTSYWYWQNIACSTGKTISYFLGLPVSKAAGVHSDVLVDVKSFVSTIH